MANLSMCVALFFFSKLKNAVAMVQVKPNLSTYVLWEHSRYNRYKNFHCTAGILQIQVKSNEWKAH